MSNRNCDWQCQKCLKLIKCLIDVDEPFMFLPNYPWSVGSQLHVAISQNKSSSAVLIKCPQCAFINSLPVELVTRYEYQLKHNRSYYTSSVAVSHIANASQTVSNGSQEDKIIDVSDDPTTNIKRLKQSNSVEYALEILRKRGLEP